MFRVFLVDDEEIALTQLEETVPWLDNGFTVAGKESDPVRAVERIVELAPEVVFSDLRMPQMNGHELMHRVQERGIFPKFVMLSAYGNFEDARTFYRQDGFDYLLKPMQMDEVELLLEKLSRTLAAKFPVQLLEDEEERAAKEKAEALLEYVRNNFTKQTTLEQLGKQFGMSSSYICTLFTKYANTSLVGYVTDLRMAEAAKRICEGKETFKSIAIACGYKDYYYFSRVFKGYFGVSPMQYKENEIFGGGVGEGVDE